MFLWCPLSPCSAQRAATKRRIAQKLVSTEVLSHAIVNIQTTECRFPKVHQTSPKCEQTKQTKPPPFRTQICSVESHLSWRPCSAVTPEKVSWDHPAKLHQLASRHTNLGEPEALGPTAKELCSIWTFYHRAATSASGFERYGLHMKKPSTQKKQTHKRLNSQF